MIILDNTIMSVKSKFKELVNFIEDLFLKNHKCICCRKEIPDENKRGICDKCFNSMELFSGELCSKCGEMVVAGNARCDSCKEIEYHFDENRSYAAYGEVSAIIVKSLKYNGNKYISKYIANMLLEDKKYFEGVDYITFVPMSKERFKERDFNQAEEIAKDVSAAINIPVISVLEKIKENTHQAGLTRKERIKNIANTIAVKNDESFEIKDKTILVIDDVFTTGSTLSECAKVLKKKGANKVKTLTFAKTRQNMIKTSWFYPKYIKFRGKKINQNFTFY